MKEKIETLKAIIENVGIMIYILEGNFGSESLDGDGTIKDQISCYRTEGEDLQRVFESIMEEHGNEPCPFDMNKRIR